ncbi:MAG: hypothetical protein KAX65_03760 [Caldilineaceae bacterium]|nr:hypothetical protein [Caldilineaceae bacterium]
MMADNFATKDDDDSVEFTVRLENLRQLFEAPELDPFVEQARITSGVEDMTAYLSTRRLRKLPAAMATLQLPRAAALPDAAATAKAAMQRYCDARIAEAQRATATNNFDGRTKLPVGLVVAVIMVGVVFLLVWLLPDNLKPLAAVLAPVVTIASWAAIWNPVETLLYENWEERRAIQMYTCLRNMEITVTSTD